MDQHLDAAPPLFAHHEPGFRIKPSAAAAIIAAPGFDPEKVTPLVRAMIRAGHVRTRGQFGSGTKNPHIMLAPSDVAVASVLVGGLSQDLGMSDTRLFVEASTAMYSRDADDPRRFMHKHPINDAIVGVAERDELWMLRIDTYRAPIGGALAYRGVIYDLAQPVALRGPDGQIPRATLSINLTSHLIPIVAAIRRLAESN